MKKFYDTHMHVFDLSHPNLSAFLLKKGLIESMIGNGFKTRLGLLAGTLFPCIITNYIKKNIIHNPYVKNTLSFFEIPIEYQFLLLDYFLKHPNNSMSFKIEDNNLFAVNGEGYSKIVLCPLSVDFGYDKLNETGVFYNKAPYKPIAKQIGDLFYSIYTYYRFNLSPHEINERKLQLNEIAGKTKEEIKREKLFEIYPFMGLNTRNYALDSLTGKAGKTGLLDKYFSNFKKDETPSQRRERLYEKMGYFDGKMYEKDEAVYKDIFVGIKVYPQLGFDPYPDAEDKFYNKAKVEFLYQYCCDKRIPIVTHCSDGGYKVGDNDDITNPNNKWAKVLVKYPNLALNFAHFGMQKHKKTDWQKTIINLSNNYDNVYTDISCNDSDKDFYKGLNEILDRDRGKLKNRILFGSDFSIVMLISKVMSYNHFLKAFIKSKDLHYKQELCFVNPERFLFG